MGTAFKTSQKLTKSLTKEALQLELLSEAKTTDKAIECDRAADFQS